MGSQSRTGEATLLHFVKMVRGKKATLNWSGSNEAEIKSIKT